MSLSPTYHRIKHPLISNMQATEWKILTEDILPPRLTKLFVDIPQDAQRVDNISPHQQ